MSGSDGVFRGGDPLGSLDSLLGLVGTEALILAVFVKAPKYVCYCKQCDAEVQMRATAPELCVLLNLLSNQRIGGID